MYPNKIDLDAYRAQENPDGTKTVTQCVCVPKDPPAKKAIVGSTTCADFEGLAEFEKLMGFTGHAEDDFSIDALADLHSAVTQWTSVKQINPLAAIMVVVSLTSYLLPNAGHSTSVKIGF